MKKLLVASLLLLFTAQMVGQDSRRIMVEQRHILENGKYLDSVELNIAIPKDYKGRQKINDISYSLKPKYIYTISDVSFAHFSLDQRDLIKTDTILIKIDMTLYDYDLKIAQQHRKPEKLSKRKRKKYLLNTGLYEMPMIDNAAIFNESQKKGEVELAFTIHDFVENHLSYQSYFGKDLAAIYAWKNAKGDCTEYADLMISICRSFNLPARRVAGSTVHRESNDMLSNIFKYTSHAWVEVYFSEIGWVPYDPTHSDGSSVTSFNNLETKYIYYSYDERAKRRDFWKWWGQSQFNVKSKTIVKDFSNNKVKVP